MNYPIQLTSDKGTVVTPRTLIAEPEPGSVVLTNGQHGTAFQRFFSDGLWHRVGGGRARGWAWLLTQRNLVLVYGAPERTEPR